MKAKQRPDPDLGTPEATHQPLAYTVERFAELIQGPAGTSISERTVREWCMRRIIPATKMGNRWIIPANAIERLLQEPLPDRILPFRLKE